MTGGKSDAWKKAFLSLTFHNKTVPNIARGNSSAGYFYLSLHTADPAAGNQNTREVSYPNYERVAVLRNPSGWTIVENTVYPAEDIEFPVGGKGESQVATHFGIGTESGFLVWCGPLDPPVDCGYGKQPTITKDSTITEY